MSVTRPLLALTVWILALGFSYSQNPDSLWEVHRDLLALDQLAIQNPEHLTGFFRKLDAVRAAEDDRQVVRIVHIGDSHVQADYLPGTMRRLFWRDFGEAGRGLVFPYKLAGTHGPLDYEWSGTTDWTARRRTFQRDGPAIGVSGMGLRANTTKADLHFTFDNKHPAMPFDQITVVTDEATDWFVRIDEPIDPPLASSGWQYHRVQSGETLYGLAREYQCKIIDLQNWNRLSGHQIFVGQSLRVGKQMVQSGSGSPMPGSNSRQPFLRKQNLPEPAEELLLVGQNPAGPSLYGIILENMRRSGVLYHMVGVNGTTYYHYHRSGEFWDQLPALAPDLVIITLGTNEALQSSFRPTEVEREVSGFLERLKISCPGAGILLMTNPDAGDKSGKKLDRPAEMRDILLSAARESGVAVFDWFAIMGGRGSVYPWREEQLVYRDVIHFTKKGYTFQGYLLYRALMTAYANRH